MQWQTRPSQVNGQQKLKAWGQRRLVVRVWVTQRVTGNPRLNRWVPSMPWSKIYDAERSEYLWKLCFESFQEKDSLPILHLYDPPDPKSSGHVKEVILTDAEAYYYAWCECCLACGSTGDPNKLVYCMDCGEAYHSYCAAAPIGSMDDYAKCSWRCVNCKLCEACGREHPGVDLIQCEICDKGYHMNCLTPPLAQVSTMRMSVLTPWMTTTKCIFDDIWQTLVIYNAFIATATARIMVLWELCGMSDLHQAYLSY